MSVTSEVEIPTALFLKARQVRARYGDVSHMWLVRRQKDAGLPARRPVRAAPANSQRVVGLRRRLIGIMWVTRVTHICDARGSHIRRRRRRGIRQPIPMH